MAQSLATGGTECSDLPLGPSNSSHSGSAILFFCVGLKVCTFPTARLLSACPSWTVHNIRGFAMRCAHSPLSSRMEQSSHDHMYTIELKTGRSVQHQKTNKHECSLTGVPHMLPNRWCTLRIRDPLRRLGLHASRAEGELSIGSPWLARVHCPLCLSTVVVQTNLGTILRSNRARIARVLPITVRDTKIHEHLHEQRSSCSIICSR